MPLSQLLKEQFAAVNNHETFQLLASGILKGVYDEEIIPCVEELLVLVGPSFIPILLERFSKRISSEVINQVFKKLLERYTGNNTYCEDLDCAIFRATILLITYGADINATVGHSENTLLTLLLEYRANYQLRYRLITELLSSLKTTTFDYKPLLTRELKKLLKIDDPLDYWKITLNDDDFAVIILLFQAGANPQETYTEPEMSLGMCVIVKCIHSSSGLSEKYLPILLRSGCKLRMDFLTSHEQNKLMVTRDELSSIFLRLAFLQFPDSFHINRIFKLRLLYTIHSVVPQIKKFWASIGIPRHLNGDADYIFARVNPDSLRLEIQALVRMQNPRNKLALFCLCLIEERLNPNNKKSKLAQLPFDSLILIINQMNPKLTPLIKMLYRNYGLVRDLIRQNSSLIIYQRKPAPNESEPRFNFFLSSTAFSRHFKPASVGTGSEFEEQELSRKVQAKKSFNSHRQLFKSAAEVVVLVDDIKNQPAYAGVDLTV